MQQHAGERGGKPHARPARPLHPSLLAALAVRLSDGACVSRPDAGAGQIVVQVCDEARHSTQRLSQHVDAFGGLAHARKDCRATSGADIAEAPGFAERWRLLLERRTQNSGSRLLHRKVCWVAPQIRASPPWPMV